MGEQTRQSNSDGSRRSALRVGILQDGRLVEERVIGIGASRGSRGGSGEVLVGSDARCTLLLPPQPGVPHAATLFLERGGRFTLLVREGMEAQVAFAPGAPPLTIRGEPGAMRRQELDDEARGRVLLGDVTLLFQVVRVAPPAPRPVLPPSLHDSLMRHLDWWMVGTAAASFMAHAVLMLVLHGYDPPRRPSPDEIPYHPATWTDQVWELPKALPPVPPTIVRSGGGHGGKSVPRDHHTPSSAPPRAPDRAAILRLVTAMTGGDDPTSSLRDLLRTGGSFEDAEKVLASADSTTKHAGLLPLVTRDRGPGPQVIGIPGLRGPQVGDVRTEDRADAKTGGRAPRCPGGVCTPEGPETPDIECDPGAIADKMRQYRGALVACYEHTRRENPSAGGKVRLNLTIARSGRVTHADVEPEGLDSDRLNTCLTASARHWIFPELQCDQLSVSQVIVFTPSER